MSEVRKPISRDAAERVRRIVIDHFPAYTRDEHGKPLPDDGLPVLRAPGTGWGEHWTLAWEGGSPYEWPILVSTGGRTDSGAWVDPAEFPPGVFAEPVNGIELGLYPPHEW